MKTLIGLALCLSACGLGDVPVIEPLDNLQQHLVGVKGYALHPRPGDLTRHLIVVADNPDTVIAHGTDDPTSVRVPGIRLTITVTGGSGSVSPTSVVTDRYGEARFDWQLDPSGGGTVHLENDSGQFHADYSVTTFPADSH